MPNDAKIELFVKILCDIANEVVERADQSFSKNDRIAAIKSCEEDKGQPCVCGALVQCTSALDSSETVHMIKSIRGNAVKVAEIEQLDECDIMRNKEFSGCKYSPNQKCILSYGDNIIEGDVWQDIDTGVKQGPTGGTLNASWSYMICNYGPGIIYFKDSGQDFRTAMYREAVSQIFGIPDEFSNLSNDEILFATVIFGEAGNSSPASWEAIANVIMNRVGAYEWSEYKNPIEIIKNTGFDAYNYPNAPFKEAEEYFKKRDYSNNTIEEMILTVIPIFREETTDSTDGCIAYYSPNAQRALHEKKPQKYGEKPNWDFEKLEEIKIDGTENDDFKFYRYK